MSRSWAATFGLLMGMGILAGCVDDPAGSEALAPLASKNDLELVLAFGEEDFGNPRQEFAAWHEVEFSAVLRSVADHPVMANAQSEQRIEVLVWDPSGIEATGSSSWKERRIGQQRVELPAGGNLTITVDFSRFSFAHEPTEGGQYTTRVFSLDYRIYTPHEHFWIK